MFDVDIYRLRRQNFLNHQARRLSHKVREPSKRASTSTLVLSERHILHEPFKRGPGL